MGVLRRNSSTRRRSRSLVIVSPTTWLAACKARSATSARSSPIARTFSASISAAARVRRRSSSSLVAAMSASRDSCATFWARARISFASRRASARDATRSASAFSRSRRACSASLSPCSIRSLRSESIFETGLNANVQMIARNSRKLAEAMMTWNRFTWKSGAAASASVVRRTTSRPSSDVTDRMSTIAYSVPGRLRGLDEDREQADDDREDAEALGEGREDDRDTADLSGRVGVAADGRGRQAAQDADADAGAEHPESSESGADVLHVVQFLLLPERAARVHWTLDGCAPLALQCAGCSPDGSLPSIASSASSATWPSSSW